jgi:hypothetical protein
MATAEKLKLHFRRFKLWGAKEITYLHRIPGPRLTIQAHEDLVDFLHGLAIGLMLGFMAGFAILRML